MSKRTRHARGYYASLFEARDKSFTLKYRPRSKPSVMGFYEVERIVAKRVKAGREEYFIHWKNYSPAENTWEPANHLPEELIAAFADKFVDPIRVDESRERLALLFEKGLKSPGACNETITMRHDVLRSLFPGMPLALSGTPYLASEEELMTAGLGSSLRKCLTVTGGGCCVHFPISLKLLLGKSPAFLDEQGRKTASRPVEKVQVRFTKDYFTGSMQ